jgi:SulP family sulfate permease
VLSAILMMVAWNMSDLEHFRHIFKAPRGDVAIMLTTFFLTVLVDLTVAVEVGMILAAFLFMKKMKDISKIIPLSALDKDDLEEKPIEKKHIPEGVDVYEIAGPFFFGVADNLKNVLTNMESTPVAFIFRMGKVPVIDASGMHSLSELYIKCKKEGTVLMLSEVSHSLFVTLKKFGMIDLIGEEHIFHSFDAALKESSLLKKEQK